LHAMERGSEDRKRRDAYLLGRTKKYPSIAADEVFWPHDLSDVLKPLFDVQNAVFNPLQYVTELICSEVFLVTSPANLLPLARCYQELRSRFEPVPVWPDTTKAILDGIAHDFRQFAQDTDFQTTQRNRRSILLVPAMTSRSVDYAVLGQAGFLAANLAMVFCNASVKGLARGQSCFIGHDSWDREDDHHQAGSPTCDPYHGVAPGLYRPTLPNRGWLGEEEQALVIADVNPESTANTKPRPQFQERPLRLVAHLPVIESWSMPRSRPNHCADSLSCSRTAAQCRCMAATPDRQFEDVALELMSVLGGEQRPLHRYQNTIEDVDATVLGRALERLHKAAQHSAWLDLRRRAYEREHANNPQAWPPPVALDWLWVDLGNPDGAQFPNIEVPPYCRLGEHGQRE
ncbi:MAG: hypothetical protein U1E05_21670, partial [Patescibacteria group bacterium]|nr:hypothetical protein [Patescibacteria group bacterium]